MQGAAATSDVFYAYGSETAAATNFTDERNQFLVRHMLQAPEALQALAYGIGFELLPHMLNHLPGARRHLERFGEGIAQLHKAGAATACARRGVGHHHALARQMLGDGFCDGVT